jgi:uncharacterized membrane protein YsdA (DUF1294 family)/cold shock CspA family protein
MRYQGKVIKWYDDKGFGFIRATADSKDVFLHVSQIHQLKKRPEVNELVTYEITKDEKGRFRAVNVAYLVAQESPKKSDNSTSFSFIFLAYIFLFTAFVLERSLTGHLPLFYILIYLSANSVVFLYYYQDKASAIKHNWRTPESTLHWLSILGGWGGAYIAQKIFKHKHKKASFMFTYKFTVIFNCLAIILYAAPQLLVALQTLLF